MSGMNVYEYWPTVWPVQPQWPGTITEPYITIRPGTITIRPQLPAGPPLGSWQCHCGTIVPPNMEHRCPGSWIIFG